MSHKSRKNSNNYFGEKCDDFQEQNSNINEENNFQEQNDNSEDTSSESSNEISDDDKEALRLLSLQLRGILLSYYGDTLVWNSTMQGITFILSKYDNIEGNEPDTTLAPDVIALQAAYTSLATKLIFINIAFTRFNTLSRKQAEGSFKYSLWPNYFINIANVLSLLVSYYSIKAAKGIIDRDRRQPVFGLR